MNRIAIVGGGWSGLACAEHLAQAGLGNRIDLFESAPQFGGRARGLLWSSEGDQGTRLEAPIDAGQHLLIEAYIETLNLLRRVDPQHHTRWTSGWLGWRSHEVEGERVRHSISLMHLLPELLLALPHLRRVPSGHETVQGWFERGALSPQLCQSLLRPLAESALNTDWSEASACCLHRVFIDASQRGPLSLRALHPRRNLSLDAIDPLTQWLQAAGVSLLPRSRVCHLEPASHGAWRLEGTSGALGSHYQDVVLALPAQEARQLLGQEGHHGQEQALQSRAIGTLFLHLPLGRPVRSVTQIQCLQVGGRPALPVIGLARPPGPWGQVVSLVVSALSQDRDRHDLALEGAWAAARAWLHGEKPLRSKWIVDRQATWAATPQAIQAQATQEPYRQFGDGRWQCGDHLVSGYPATIESAVRSGRAAAQALLRSIGQTNDRVPH